MDACAFDKGWERVDVGRSGTTSEIGSVLVSYSHHSTLQHGFQMSFILALQSHIVSWLSAHNSEHLL